VHLGDHGIPPEGTRLLYADATGMRDYSRRLNLSLKTVRRYVRADQPERLQRAPQYRPALVDPQGHPTVHVRAWPGA